MSASDGDFHEAAALPPDAAAVVSAPDDSPDEADNDDDDAAASRQLTIAADTSDREALVETAANSHGGHSDADDEDGAEAGIAELEEKSTASPCSVPEPCAFRTPPPQPHQQSTQLPTDSTGGLLGIEVERSCMETRGHVNVKWDITRKNKTSIVIDGYKMTESRAGKDGRVFWRCSKRFCSATAISLGPRLLSVRQVDSRRFHNHPPTGRDEFFRGDFGSPGTPTQVTIKWPVTRMSVASAADVTAGVASAAAFKRGRRLQLPSSTTSDEIEAMEESAAARGETETDDEAVTEALLSSKRMRHASLDDLASIQQRLVDPLGSSFGGGSGGGGGLQALAAAAGLHGSGFATAEAATQHLSSRQGLQQQQPSLLTAGSLDFKMQQQQPQPQQQQKHLLPHQQNHNSHSQLQQQQQSLIASLEAQKFLLSLALGGGLTSSHDAAAAPSSGFSPSQPPPYNPIFNPPPPLHHQTMQQQQQHLQHLQPTLFPHAALDEANSSPLKEALSQIDNSQLRRQLRRLEGYFRGGIVAVSESIFRHGVGGSKDSGERESLLRLFNYMEGLERVQKLTAELP